MSETLKPAVHAAMRKLLQPLAKLLLEAGVGVGEITTLVKSAFVEAALKQAGTAGNPERPNASRISVLTGLTRVEVASILAARQDDARVHDRHRQRAERVLSGWWNDPAFQNEDGSPATLPVKGVRRSFAALCVKYSGQERNASILTELLRVKAVRRLKDGRLQALSRTYATVRWDPDGIAALGAQLSELAETLLFNLKNRSRPRLVRRVLNTRLNTRFAPVLIRDLEQRAGVLADSVDDVLNDPQYTVSPRDASSEVMRLGLGIYLIEESAEAESAHERAVRPRRVAGRRTSRKGNRKG